MPNLPSAPAKSSSLDLSKPQRLDPIRWYVVEGLTQGLTLPEIAQKAYPRSAKKRKRMRGLIRRWSRFDGRFQMMVGMAAQGEMLMGLAPASQALVRRANRGRPDAIKLLFEATNFHNPRVKHEHSGDVKVTIDIPRPKRVSNEDEDIVDANVVED